MKGDVPIDELGRSYPFELKTPIQQNAMPSGTGIAQAKHMLGGKPVRVAQEGTPLVDGPNFELAMARARLRLPRDASTGEQPAPPPVM